MFKKVFQIEIRVQAIGLRRLDDGINRRTGPSPLGGRTEQPVLPADGEGPDGVLRQVVGQGAPPVFQIGHESFLVLQGIGNSLSKGAFGQDGWFCFFKPAPEFFQNGLFLFQPLPATFLIGQFLHLPFCGEQGIAVGDGLFAEGSLPLGLVLRQGVDEVPPQMGEAQAAGDVRNLVVAGVGIGVEVTLEAFEEGPRVFPAPSGPVIEDPDGMVTVLPGGVQPHVGGGGVAPAVFPHDLYRGLIGMKDLLLLHGPGHPVLQGDEVVPGREDHPVGQGGPGYWDAQGFPFLFLTVQGHGVDVFLVHGPGNGGWGGEGMADDGIRQRGLLDMGSLQLPAGQAFVAFLIMILDVEPGRDVDELAADEGLPDTLHQGAAPAAKTVAVGELVDDLLMGEGGQVGFPPALLLLPAGIAGDGFIQGGFLDFGVSLCLGFVEKEGDLVLIDDGFRPFGLPPVKLPGQGGDLVGQAHQFRSQFFMFFLEGLVFLDQAFVVSHQLFIFFLKPDIPVCVCH